MKCFNVECTRTYAFYEARIQKTIVVLKLLLLTKNLFQKFRACQDQCLCGLRRGLAAA
jgi:hypothetical protein